MNLVTNLVITKLGEEFGDIFVTLFGDSPNWVMILMTFSSPHLVGHQIGWWFWWQIWWQICWFAKFGDIFGDEYCDEFSDKFCDKKGDQKRSSNLSTKFVNHQIRHQSCHQSHHPIWWATKFRALFTMLLLKLPGKFYRHFSKKCLAGPWVSGSIATMLPFLMTSGDIIPWLVS